MFENITRAEKFMEFLTTLKCERFFNYIILFFNYKNVSCNRLKLDQYREPLS